MTQIVKCPLSSQMQNPPAKFQMQFHFILIYCSFLFLTQQLPNKSVHHYLNACSQRALVNHWHRTSGRKDFWSNTFWKVCHNNGEKLNQTGGRERLNKTYLYQADEIILNGPKTLRIKWNESISTYLLECIFFEALIMRQVVDKILILMSRAKNEPSHHSDLPGAAKNLGLSLKITKYKMRDYSSEGESLLGHPY